MLDLVFSLDSIITAVGMTEHIPVMVIAVIVAVGVMLWAADPLGEFIRRNPTIVMLALGFLLLIGTTLIADGFGFHVPKGTIYAAMAFSGLRRGSQHDGAPPPRPAEAGRLAALDRSPDAAGSRVSRKRTSGPLSRAMKTGFSGSSSARSARAEPLALEGLSCFR